jgi:hypothetical protein
MNRLINTMAKLAIFKSDFDYHLMRASNGVHRLFLWLSGVVPI